MQNQEFQIQTSSFASGNILVVCFLSFLSGHTINKEFKNASSLHGQHREKEHVLLEKSLKQVLFFLPLCAYFFKVQLKKSQSLKLNKVQPDTVFVFLA